jgi:phosphonate transport system substrate-binding protein
MSEYAPGRALLEPLNVKGFEMAADPDWDDVRALDIGILDDIATPDP